jgi:ribosomal protein S18 acetylase RimI-like enzyme
MKIRPLDHGDLERLSEFVSEAYRDYPLATWFESAPTAGQIESIFYSKLRSVGSRELVDIVTEDNGTIAGECEVAKIGFDTGVIGILVRSRYRSKNVGSDMLREAVDDAVDIGITKFTAEVDEANTDALRFFAKNGFLPIGYRNVEIGGGGRRIVILQHSVR